jgi:(2Fe-2S) ferredoxin
MDLRGGPKDLKITVHMGTCGIAAGARDILVELADQLTKAGADTVMLTQSGCIGLCQQEPMMTLRDAAGKEFLYGPLDVRKVGEIVRQHILGGSPVVDCIINPPQGTLIKGEN